MTLIGVTGSFATGKSTVSSFFKEEGALVLDADKIVHSLYKKDKKIKGNIKKAFGEKVFINNSINRKKLGEVVFKDKRKLKKLCSIVHPKVIKIIKEKASLSKKKASVIDAPLLMEASLDKYVDYVVVVKASHKKQIERCKKKGFDKNDLMARRSCQIPLSKKVKKADFVIDNNGSKQKTKNKVKRIWKKILGG